MRKSIRAILFISLTSLFVGSVSFSDQNVRIEIEDAGEMDEKWHSSRNPNRLQFKHFEAVVQDSTGKQYALVASMAGNRYMYEVHAWLANPDEWYEIYKEQPKIKSRGPDVWTEDRQLIYTGDIRTGWRVEARGEKAAFDVMSTPGRPTSRYSVAGESADIDGYISFGTKVNGKIVIGGQSIKVEGLGYCIHTFGDMGKHITWRYLGFKDEKLCITAMNARFNEDRMNLFVTVDDDMEMIQYEPQKVLWKEVDQNTWQISATHNEPGQSERQIDINVHLIKPRPTNKEQPYSKYSLAFITFSTTNLYEYLADVRVTITGPNSDERVEFRSPGIVTRFELIR